MQPKQKELKGKGGKGWIVFALSLVLIGLAGFLGYAFGYSGAYSFSISAYNKGIAAGINLSNVAWGSSIGNTIFVVTPALWTALNESPASMTEYIIKSAQQPCTVWFAIAQNITIQQCKEQYLGYPASDFPNATSGSPNIPYNSTNVTT